MTYRKGDRVRITVEATALGDGLLEPDGAMYEHRGEAFNLRSPDSTLVFLEDDVEHQVILREPTPLVDGGIYYLLISGGDDYFQYGQYTEMYDWFVGLGCPPVKSSDVFFIGKQIV